MRYNLSGTVMQTVGIDLDPGETVYSQSNCMCWMNDAIAMDTHTGGGLFAGIKRSFSGGTLFVTDFTARGAGHVAFAPRFPGTIMPLQLAPGQSLLCRKETFSLRGEVRHARYRLAQTSRRRFLRRPGLHPAKGDRPRHGLARSLR